MRITILANRDIASCFALNKLLPMLSQRHTCNVFLSSVVGKKKSAAPPAGLQQLKFFEQQLFNDVVFPIIEPLSASASTSDGYLTFGQLSRFTEGAVTTLNTINGNDFERYKNTLPDLVLSIRYGAILREAAIDVPRHGVLNLHSGRLPQYRGVMATFWAMLNGDSTIGTTLHTIDDRRIDSGRILGLTSRTVRADKSYLWHVLSLYDDGVRLMERAVQRIDEGDPPPAEPQPADSLSTPKQNYYTFPTAHDLDAFAAKGFALVDIEEMCELARRFGTPKR